MEKEERLFLNEKHVRRLTLVYRSLVWADRTIFPAVSAIPWTLSQQSMLQDRAGGGSLPTRSRKSWAEVTETEDTEEASSNSRNSALISSPMTSTGTLHSVLYLSNLLLLASSSLLTKDRYGALVCWLRGLITGPGLLYSTSNSPWTSVAIVSALISPPDRSWDVRYFSHKSAEVRPWTVSRGVYSQPEGSP
jgi:hypothetical protein